MTNLAQQGRGAMRGYSSFFSILLMMTVTMSTGGCSSEGNTNTPDGSPGDSDSGDTEDETDLTPVVRFADLEDYTAVEGVTTIEVTVDAAEQLDRVELVTEDRMLAVSDAPPFTLSWDTTNVSDGLVEVSLLAIDGAGQSSRSGNLPLVVVNHGAAMVLEQGESGTITIPSDFDGSQETHVKHHWTASREYRRALGIFLWDADAEEIPWEIELTMGIGICPHSGMAFEPSVTSSTGVVVLDVTPAYGLPDRQRLFIHAGTTSPESHMGHSLSYRVKVFAFEEGDSSVADRSDCPVNSGYPCTCEGVSVCADGNDCVAFYPGAPGGICSANCFGLDDEASCSNTLGFGTLGGCYAGVDPNSPDHCMLECVIGDDEAPCPQGQSCVPDAEGALCFPDDFDDSGDPDGPPCYGVSSLGCCQGTVVRFCESDALYSLECDPYNCGWSDVLGMFKCNGQDTPPDGVSLECPPDLPPPTE